MPARRELTMRQLRQMLWLNHKGVSARDCTHGWRARSTIPAAPRRECITGFGRL
jgi:hypothetical protein